MSPFMIASSIFTSKFQKAKPFGHFLSKKILKKKIGDEEQFANLRKKKTNFKENHIESTHESPPSTKIPLLSPPTIPQILCTYYPRMGNCLKLPDPFKTLPIYLPSPPRRQPTPQYDPKHPKKKRPLPKNLNSTHQNHPTPTSISQQQPGHGALLRHLLPPLRGGHALLQLQQLLPQALLRRERLSRRLRRESKTKRKTFRLYTFLEIKNQMGGRISRN